MAVYEVPTPLPVPQMLPSWLALPDESFGSRVRGMLTVAAGSGKLHRGDNEQLLECEDRDTWGWHVPHAVFCEAKVLPQMLALHIVS